jgi:hypothetical protein
LSYSGYTLEVLEEGFNRWDKLTNCSAGLSYTAKDLRNGRTYKFRVRAENIYGPGAPVETGNIQAKNPYGQFH